jgi:hypothetical protein
LIFKGLRLSVGPFRRERAAAPAPSDTPTPTPPRRRRRGAGLRPLPLFALCLVIAVATLILTRTFAGPTYSAGRHSGPTVSADGQEPGQDPGTGEDGGATEDPGTGTGGGQGGDPASDGSTGEDPTTDRPPAGDVTGRDAAPVPVPQPQAPAAPPPVAPPPVAPAPAPSTPAGTVPSAGPSPSASASPIPAPVVSFEAEATTNTLSAGAKVVTCAACSGGRKVGHLGRGTGTLAFNDIHVTGTGKLELTIAYLNGDRSARTATLSVNGAAPVELTFAPTGDWNTTGVLRVSVVVKDGANTLTLGGAGPAPDLDKISLG